MNQHDREDLLALPKSQLDAGFGGRQLSGGVQDTPERARRVEIYRQQLATLGRIYYEPPARGSDLRDLHAVRGGAGMSQERA